MLSSGDHIENYALDASWFGFQSGKFSHGIESISFFLVTKSLSVIGNGTRPIVDGGSLARPYIPDIPEITEFAGS